MKLSQFFLPNLKEIPSDATIASHKLMLKSGIISKNSQGLYTILPLGMKVLKKIQRIIEDELDSIGAMQISLPIMQDADLWKKGGRFETYGKELLVANDRNDKDLVFSPTAELSVADIFQKNVKSYKELPLSFYQINAKFRDEIRPRFGILRAKEFLMLDCYSFHLNSENSQNIYQKYYNAFHNIFKKCGVNSFAMKADTGEIGGDLSHEFCILAESGETKIAYDANFQNVQEIPHDANESDYTSQELKIGRAIEVGHIFSLGDTYTKPLDVKILDNSGKNIYPLMNCYGIGVSRLLAAIIEASHDEKGIIWPMQLSPFDVIIINLAPNDERISKISENCYNILSQKLNVLLDDTNKSVGEKFAVADLIGIPLQIIIGKNQKDENLFETIYRKDNSKLFQNFSEIFQFFLHLK